MTPTRITLIDDHAEFRQVITELLTEDGHDVSALSGDRTSIEEIAATGPDLLILDLILVGGSDQMSGWEYLKLIRAHADLRSVPVLVCSGDHVALHRRRRELGRDTKLSVLGKPFSVEEVERAIAGLLHARRLPEWDDERELVLIADASARLVDASTAALRILGMSLEELRSHSVADIVAQGVEWTQTEWQRYRELRRWEGPVVLRRPDGKEIPARASAEILEAASTEWHISRLSVADPA